MEAEDVGVAARPAAFHVAPKRFLSALLAVGRSGKPGEYVIFYFGSGLFFRTDRLGVRLVQSLINGLSSDQAIERIERIEPGSGERARRLIEALDSFSAMAEVPPVRSGPRREVRRLTSVGMGLMLSVLGQVVRLAPISVVALMFQVWPSTPIARHIWRCSQTRILLSLRQSGYSDMPDLWLRRVGCQSAAEPSRSRLFMYLSVCLSPERLGRLVNCLFDRRSAEALSADLRAHGPIVAAFLHGPLAEALPNALRVRGHQVVRAFNSSHHGANVSERSGPMGNFFGETPEMTTYESDPGVSGTLLRHLKAGRNVYIALDKVASNGNTPKVEMLGQCFARNDGPAWIAVRSGRPVALWTTQNSPSGVVIKASPALNPDPSLPVHLRVADLSEQLYAYAEAAIRMHPSDWQYWHALSLIKGSSL